MWFKSLVGFREKNAENVRENLQLNGDSLVSLVNGRQMKCGYLTTPSLHELRTRVGELSAHQEATKVREVVADVQELHSDPTNAGALFQVASQFNLLEMVSPSVSPEDGVDIYESDRTQGPACAIACGAGTIYRNYFVRVGAKIGQTEENQINCLNDLGSALGNTNENHWFMRNGYALATADGLKAISRQLDEADEVEKDRLRGELRIGIHENTEVTIGDSPHTVTQAYCSALPVSYSSHSSDLWADFAQLVLEASYEATMCAAILNSQMTQNNHVFLTLLGGGAFGNRDSWIFAALRRALNAIKGSGLQVSIVSYGSSKPLVRELVDSFPN